MSVTARVVDPYPATEPRPGLRRIGYVLAGLVCLLVFLIFAGALYQWVTGYRDRSLNPPPGLLVKVDDFRMHLYCIGQGSPTVVLDSGIGDSWLSWRKVQPDVAMFTRVCSYDRAGMGWSDKSPNPRTSKFVAKELHTLLKNASTLPPFVLVGHSFGGLNMRMYASLYPADVAGVVLVDSTPDDMSSFPTELRMYNDTFLRKENLKQSTMPLGIPRLMGWCGNGPLELRAAFRATDCRLQPWREHLAEYYAGDESMAQVRAGGLLGGAPLIVLSHDPGEPSDNFMKAMEKAWEESQENFTHLSIDSTRIIAKGSHHNIQLDRPDAVVEAIGRVVDKYRKRRSATDLRAPL